MPLVKVPLTVIDHLRRAQQVYGDRVGVIDEPTQPAEPWGEVTYAEMARRARAQAAGLDALGLEVGERVAVVSHNSARLLTSFYGVSGFGRILVPINSGILSVIRAIPGVSNAGAIAAQERGHKVQSFEVQAKRDVREQLGASLQQAGFPLLALAKTESELDDVFLKLAGGTTSAEKGAA